MPALYSHGRWMLTWPDNGLITLCDPGVYTFLYHCKNWTFCADCECFSLVSFTWSEYQTKNVRKPDQPTKHNTFSTWILEMKYFGIQMNSEVLSVRYSDCICSFRVQVDIILRNLFLTSFWWLNLSVLNTLFRLVFRQI